MDYIILDTVPTTRPHMIDMRYDTFFYVFPAVPSSSQGRLKAARDIALAGNVFATSKAGVFEVISQRGPDSTYVVDIKARSCTCPDASYRGITQPCKHRLAVALAVGWHRVDPTEPTVSPDDLIESEQRDAIHAAASPRGRIAAYRIYRDHQLAANLPCIVTIPGECAWSSTCSNEYHDKGDGTMLDIANERLVSESHVFNVFWKYLPG